MSCINFKIWVGRLENLRDLVLALREDFKISSNCKVTRAILLCMNAAQAKKSQFFLAVKAIFSLSKMTMKKKKKKNKEIPFSFYFTSALCC